jgi:hypothetical protein
MHRIPMNGLENVIEMLQKANATCHTQKKREKMQTILYAYYKMTSR